MNTFIEIFTLITGVVYVVLEIRQKNFMWIVGVVTSLAAMYMFFTQGLFASFALNCYYFGISFWGLYQWSRDARRLAAGEGLTAKAEVGMFRERTEDEADADAGRGTEDEKTGARVETGNEVCVDAGCGTEDEGKTGNEIVTENEDKTRSGTEIGEKVDSGDVIHLNKMSWWMALICAAAFVAGFFLLRYVLKLLHDPMTGLDGAVAVLSAVATFMLARSYIQQWLVWIVADTLSAILCVSSGMYWMTVLYVVYVLSAVYGYIYWRKHGVYIIGN